MSETTFGAGDGSGEDYPADSIDRWTFDDEPERFGDGFGEPAERSRLGRAFGFLTTETVGGSGSRNGAPGGASKRAKRPAHYRGPSSRVKARVPFWWRIWRLFK